jgi:capsular polysaccharide biosynthesis protein
MGALAAGGGLVVLLEALQSTIFRTADILRVVDSHLLVTIPYITTKSELAAQRRKIKLIIAISVLVLFVAAIIALFLLPPLDVLFNSIFVKLGI